MALRAAEREAEERQTGHLRHVVEDVLPLLDEVGSETFLRIKPQKAGGNQCLRIARLQLIAGKLLPHEAIVGQIFVEGPDDIVAIAIRIGAKKVGPETRG